MFKTMFLVQWKWTRWTALLLALAMMVVPLWVMGGSQEFPESVNRVSRFANRLDAASNLLRWLAVAGGFALAMHAWWADQSRRHVYALTLPIPRWRLVMHRYVNGALITVGIAGAFWLAALLATSIVAPPQGLHAYPGGLALRIGVTMLAVYALSFALWSSTRRAAYYLASAAVVGFVGLAVADAAGIEWPMRIAESIWVGSGFAELLEARWYLIDV